MRFSFWELSDDITIIDESAGSNIKGRALHFTQ
jgi:hypothetical protein